jgi:hypothetical protein
VHTDDTCKGEWDCDIKVSVIYGPFFELFTYEYRYFACIMIVKPMIMVSILEFGKSLPKEQLYGLILLEVVSFGMVYLLKPHLDGTERVASLGGSLINIFFLLCPLWFVYFGYEAADAAGTMISAQMMVIAMEVYNQLSTVMTNARNVCRLLCGQNEVSTDEVDIDSSSTEPVPPEPAPELEPEPAADEEAGADSDAAVDQRGGFFM